MKNSSYNTFWENKLKELFLIIERTIFNNCVLKQNFILENN